jgi:hypothetical protein
MSVANSIQKGDFDLNLISLQKPLEFPNGTIQTTAYTGAVGTETLNEVLIVGNDAGGLGITNVGTIVLANGKNVENITSVVFTDNTTQNTAFTGVVSTGVVFSNLTPVVYTLTQPLFSQTLTTLANLPIGYYQLSINNTIQNVSSAPVVFNFILISIQGGTNVSVSYQESDFTLATGDIQVFSTNLTFLIPVAQSVSISIGSAINSGAFVGTAPTWTISNVNAIRLTNTISS